MQIQPPVSTESEHFSAPVLVFNKDLFFGVTIVNTLRTLGYAPQTVRSADTLATGLADHPETALVIVDITAVDDWPALQAALATQSRRSRHRLRVTYQRRRTSLRQSHWHDTGFLQRRVPPHHGRHHHPLRPTPCHPDRSGGTSRFPKTQNPEQHPEVLTLSIGVRIGSKRPLTWPADPFLPRIIPTRETCSYRRTRS